MIKNKYLTDEDDSKNDYEYKYSNKKGDWKVLNIILDQDYNIYSFCGFNKYKISPTCKI